MEVDSEDATSQCLLNKEAATSQNLLNTEYDQLIGGEDTNSSESEDYGLTGYQQPPPQVPLRGKNDAKKKNLQRKASEVPTATTAKIKKTEESITLYWEIIWKGTLVRSHLNTPHGPTYRQTNNLKRTLRPSNRKPSAVLSKPKTKFQEMSMANRKGRTDSKNVNVSTTYRGS